MLGLISTICPIIVSGNTALVIASENIPLSSITLAEILATSDVPSGVVNILTGQKEELIDHLAKHMDVNAIYVGDKNTKYKKSLQLEAVDNLKE